MLHGLKPQPSTWAMKAYQRVVYDDCKAVTDNASAKDRWSVHLETALVEHRYGGGGWWCRNIRMAWLVKCLSANSSQWLCHNPATTILINTELHFNLLTLCWRWAWWSKHQKCLAAKLCCFFVLSSTIWQFQETFGLGGVPLGSVLGQLAFIIFKAKFEQNEDDVYACHTRSFVVEWFLFWRILKLLFEYIRLFFLIGLESF